MANDEELCQYLVEQDDENVGTEREKHESNGPANVAVNVESEPMSISDDSNEFSTALQQLKTLASQNSFTIHDVLYDGDCMFSAVSYQLR